MSAARLPWPANASAMRSLMTPPGCGGPRSAACGRRAAGFRGRSKREDLREVLVSAPGQAHEVYLALGLLEQPGDRVRRLERRDDALDGGQLTARRDRLRAGDRHVARPAGVAQP